MTLSPFTFATRVLLVLFTLGLPIAKAQPPALIVRVEDPCQIGKTLREISVVRDDRSATAGDATVMALDAWGVEYQGSREGVQSILKSPTSLEAVVMESDDSFRIHGWCYQVDGVEPGVMAGDFKLDSAAKIIRWFFGYARYRAGTWEGYCSTDLTHTEYCTSRLGVRIERR